MEVELVMKVIIRRCFLIMHVVESGKINKVRKERRFWVHPINTVAARLQQGDYDNLLQEMRLMDSTKYFNHLRMSPELFDKLLLIVGPKISKLYVHRETLAANLRLSLTLRYLASGDSMISIARQFRVGESTTSLIIRETCNELWNTLKDSVPPGPTEELWRKCAKTYDTWDFPNCIAALDGKHVVIQAPPHSGSVFYNYKGCHSIVLMAMCTGDYNFILVDIGAQGRLSDGGIFKTSEMGQKFHQNKMNVPGPSKISEDRPELPFVVVADEAFPLSNYLLRPYPGKNLSEAKRVFNYRLSRARRCIENTFGIMTGRWRIYRKPIIASLETLDSIVKATVVLHNYIMQSEATMALSKRQYCPSTFIDNEDRHGAVTPGEWRNFSSNGLSEIGRAGSNYYNAGIRSLRDEFMEYFIDEGAINFQWKNI